MDKTIYIIGHKNPDTDAVTSAVAYAKLKNLLGHDEYKAARAGHLNPQTEYVFSKFGITPPKYLPDLNPKVEHYMPPLKATVSENISVWDAIGQMEKLGTRVMPVVDKDGKYLSLLHYSGFAQNVLTILNPKSKSAIFTSINLIQKTLNAQPIITDEHSSDFFKASVLVASSSLSTFQQRLNEHASENIVVIASDREDIHKLCIENKIKLLILTSGFVINKSLREDAEKNGVSVIISPYSTAPTSMLIAYSTPVSEMSDFEIKAVHPNDTVSKVKFLLQDSPSRNLPVVDENNTVIGVISEHDILHEPNIEIVLVDHNEMSQAVDGIEHFKIQEVIDHHRIGTLSTKYPITFINKPVGSTATLITNLYKENKISIPKEIAGLLLCGILSDTLILQSATTTQMDTETAEYLSNISDLDIKTLGQEILLAGSKIGSRTASELIKQDMKEYSEDKDLYTISQIEVGNTREILDRKAEFIEELEIERRSRKALFTALLVTDITQLSSILLMVCDKKFLPFVSFPKKEENIYYLKDVVSRKKQLIPLISELISNYLR
jgi:manganese-dependent inorganic pyrophosphatase